MKSFASEPCDTKLAEVVKLYSEDLDSFKLKGQLLLLPQTAESMGFYTSEFDVNDDVANDFVEEKENRKQLFGKFSANDIPNKFSISSK